MLTPPFIPQLASRLPVVLARPLAMLPVSLHSFMLAGACRTLFREPIRNGELDFLRGHTLVIHVRDTGIQFRLTLDDSGLQASGGGAADITIEGDLVDFILLVSQQEDPDTLFFNRRLCLRGDTELGLYIKNFLDAQELPPAAVDVLHRIGGWAAAADPQSDDKHGL